MQERYRLYRRDNGKYYLEESLKMKDKAQALGLVAARNQPHAVPSLNLAMART